MKELRELTPLDLLAEGKRHVIRAGDFEPGKGFRAEVIFENHPYRFVTGEVSNLPTVKKPLYFQAKSQKAADKAAMAWCEANLGIGKRDYLAIIGSSMAAQNKARRVQVKKDPDTSEVWLRDGFGNELQLEEEHAIRLYQDIAIAYDLPFRASCPECGALFNDIDECDQCGDSFDLDE